MGRYRGAKYKICRRIGENLWGRPKCPSIKRPYPPGEAGTRSTRRKVSNYAKHLLEKQKMRSYYGLMEKQFFRTFKRANRMRGVTGDNLIQLLEMRLDALVYRLGFCPTIFAARQWVNHGHVLVNGKKVDIPSYTCRPGDEISMREKSRQNVILLETIQNSAPGNLPPYLTRADATFSGRLESRPEPKDIPIPIIIDRNLVVEFYSR
ncbi:30S ribosomal protein S4 [Candidatus Sumerlaeota bacterium]